MKLRIKCGKCGREHLRTVADEDLPEIMEMACLSCRATIRYRISRKSSKEDNKAVDDFLKLFSGFRN